MFEKGLVRENKSQLKMSDGTLVSEDITRESIPGVQWSLNGNVGIGIRLYKGLQLYVEPGVSWYIPNSSHPQPISQRTSTPLNFSLQAGLRYNIN